MNWKKLLLVAVVAAGFAFTAAPRSEARTFVSVGIGFPVGFGYGYPAYYPYAYPGYSYGYYPYPAYRVSYYYGRPFYWSHGRRIFIARRCR